LFETRLPRVVPTEHAFSVHSFAWFFSTHRVSLLVEKE